MWGREASAVHVVRFDDAATFLARAQAFLLREETANNLILGVSGRLSRQPMPPPRRPNVYLAIVEGEESTVVAAAMMTPPHNLVLSHVSDDAAGDAMRALATDLFAAQQVLPGAGGPVAVSRAFAQQWAMISGQASRHGEDLRIFQLVAVSPVVGVPGRLRHATVSETDLARQWLAAFNAETGEDETTDALASRVDALIRASAPEGLYLWDVAGHPCSMAAAVGPTRHGIRINAVYTPPALRGRGYASACVAALSQHQLDAGRRFCFLYTDVHNLTSNHIYQHIGYRLICDVESFGFADPTLPPKNNHDDQQNSEG